MRYAVVMLWLVALNACARAPEGRVALYSEAAIDTTTAKVWAKIVDIGSRRDWSQLVADAEPLGASHAPAVGTRYRATIRVERYTIPGELEVIAFDKGAKFSWRIEPHGGSALAPFVETITLRDEGGGTLARYEIAYTIAGRPEGLPEAHAALERMAAGAADSLRQAVLATP